MKPEDNGWIPIEEFDYSVQRIPFLVCDPDWYCRDYPNARVAQGYYDEYLDGWNICLFESCSSYAFVTYYSKKFKPKFWKPIPEFP